MKKRLFLASLVMAIWTLGSYGLGRHHGVRHGALPMPAVSVHWSSATPVDTELVKISYEEKEDSLVRVSFEEQK